MKVGKNVLTRGIVDGKRFFQVPAINCYNFFFNIHAFDYVFDLRSDVDIFRFQLIISLRQLSLCAASIIASVSAFYIQSKVAKL